MTTPPVARPEWRYNLALILATRGVLTVVGALAVALMTLGWRHVNALPDLPLLNMWAQWDAAHYVDIALSGYEPPTADETNIAFFPLYPLLIRVGMLATGRADEQTAALLGIVISNVGLFVALVYLSALMTRDFSLSLARRAVLYVLVFPTTVFLSSAYAEPVFLAAGVASLYHARAGEWYRAGAWGFLAALTRPFGILLVIPIGIELFRQRAGPRSWPAVLGPAIGLALFVGYLWWLFGDPLAYFRAGESWGRGFFPPWDVAARYVAGPLQLFDWPYSWLDLISVIAMAGLAILAWRELPASYAAYATAGLLFIVSSGFAWFSASRHALALFPLLIVLAVLGQRQRSFHYVWLVASILLAIAFTARVALGDWVA